VVLSDSFDGRLHADEAPLSTRGTLVASPAHEHGYTLVTRDRGFANVPELDVLFYDE
jgi:predicted nucleic acid-binding protein